MANGGYPRCGCGYVTIEHNLRLNDVASMYNRPAISQLHVLRNHTSRLSLHSVPLPTHLLANKEGRPRRSKSHFKRQFDRFIASYVQRAGCNGRPRPGDTTRPSPTGQVGRPADCRWETTTFVTVPSAVRSRATIITSLLAAGERRGSFDQLLNVNQGCDVT